MKPLALLTMLLLLAPATGSAQLLQSLPPVPAIGDPLGDVSRVLPETLDRMQRVPRAVRRLAEDRLGRLDALVRANPGRIERDDRGDPARAGEVIVDDPDDELIAAVGANDFRLIERGTIGDLGIGYARFAVPAHRSLADAVRAMRRIAGKRDVSADQLHFQSGAVSAPVLNKHPAPTSAQSDGRFAIGMIDGGVSLAAGLAGSVSRRGFASGAPIASNHGTAVASLLLGNIRIRGAAIGKALAAADVYGSDPAGGSAVAIAKALAWLSAEHVPVTVISLVGPSNPLLARVMKAVQARGMIVVAAVGNDGTAAPPAYPASYPGVIAVTAVDRRDRALIEAGHARHLDYAAPGADMLAANARGEAVAVRGTSFAAPFVAARIASHYSSADQKDVRSALEAVDHEARDLGPRGADARYGRGLLCGVCRTVSELNSRRRD